MPSYTDLATSLGDGVTHAEAVFDNWERGDLAAAVRSLMDWAADAAELVDGAEPASKAAGNA